MPKYMHLFETETEFNEERNNSYKEPWVSYTKPTSAVTYNKTEREKLLETPLTFEITSDGDIVWKASSTSIRKRIEYKKNDGEWTTIRSNSGSSAPSISVVSGDTIQFRGDNSSYGVTFASYNTFAGTTCGFKVKGNIMSLIDSTAFATATTFQSGSTGIFYKLFWGCTDLTDASELILPATEITDYCYKQMFQNCISLTGAPELPATTLASDCYSGMFECCTSLTTAPELPATTLAGNCYCEMFSGCTSLTTAPELPATTLAGQCYYSMFEDCTSLTTAPELPATTLAQGCYRLMFYYCTSLTTAPELPATTLASSCYHGMFYSCTGLTTAPALPATSLASSCYTHMFYNCTSLTTALALPATTLENYCYEGMFRRCTSLTTAPELPATTLASECYRWMFQSCATLNYIKCLATDISASDCTKDWVSGVQTTSGTFIKNPSMTSWPTGTSGIPSNWTVQDAS